MVIKILSPLNALGYLKYFEISFQKRGRLKFLWAFFFADLNNEFIFYWSDSIGVIIGVPEAVISKKAAL